MVDWRDVYKKDCTRKRPTRSLEKDPRALVPQSQSEIQALQIAINAAIEDYTYLTRRKPKPSNPWLSYNGQLDQFQTQLDKFLKKIGHEGKIWLHRLEPWKGGLDGEQIFKMVLGRTPLSDMFDRLEVFEPRRAKPQNTAIWMRTNEVPKLAAAVQARLDLPPIKERLKGDPSVDNPQEARLNSLVADDAEGYRCWLLTVGWEYYEFERWGPEGPESWDYWCRYVAPYVFVLYGRQSKKKPMITRRGLPAVEMIQRPVISYEEARRGQKLWLGVRGTTVVSDDGLAFLHAIKGHNPMLANLEFDLLNYGIGLASRTFTNMDWAAANERKRQRIISGNMPVKRMRFEEEGRALAKHEPSFDPRLIMSE